MIPQRRLAGRGRGKLLKGERGGRTVESSGLSGLAAVTLGMSLRIISQYYIGTWLFETNWKVGSIAMSPT